MDDRSEVFLHDSKVARLASNPTDSMVLLKVVALQTAVARKRMVSREPVRVVTIPSEDSSSKKGEYGCWEQKDSNAPRDRKPAYD